MVKQIVRDVFFLSQKSKEATKADLSVGRDLRDTLKANSARCAGMAANMIGVAKRIIIVNMGPFDVVMYNPCLLHNIITENCRKNSTILHLEIL